MISLISVLFGLGSFDSKIRHNLEEFSDCCKPIYENVSRIIDKVCSKLESKKD